MVCSINWNIDPIIFNLGGLQLRYYGILFVLGLVVSYFIVKKIYIKENVTIKELEKLSMFVIIGGLVGARVGHCLFYEGEYYTKDFLSFTEIFIPIKFKPEFQFVGYQGLASHGGAIGVIISLLIFKFFSVKKSFFWLMDRVVVPTGFAGACIRFGNLFNSEIYGHNTNLPWGFNFFKDEDWYKIYGALPCHPTQLYEALFYILTSVILIFLYKKEQLRNAKGFLFGIFLLLIFCFRFFIEYLKNRQVDFEKTMFLNMGQILSLPFIFLAIVLIIVSLKRNNKKANISLS